MSVTYGFYNAQNHDRRYDAVQMSSIFDGIIQDGIYMSIGDHLNVKAASGMTITVGTGRAWFDHTWTLNDSLLPIELPLSELILDRIDAVVLEVNAEENVRINSIKIIKGRPATDPAKPGMTKTNTIHQYPLAYILVKAGVTEIRQADITNMIGTSSTPFVTGAVQTMDIDSLVAKWGDQWNEWFNGIQMILASAESGEMLEEILKLIKDLYEIASNDDIDRIVNGTYVNTDDWGSIFEMATNQDIDDIIEESYVEEEESEYDEITSSSILKIINDAFAERVG